MTIILPPLAVAFAAFCVWLGVRIVNKRARWAKWTLALAVGLPVLYAASLGPACWISSHADAGAPALSAIYRPITWAMLNNENVYDAIQWYSKLIAALNWEWAGTDENWQWRKIPPGGM